MKFSHSAVKSSIYELVKTVEPDIQFGDNAWSTRIELFRDTESADRFRCRVWELELFRLTPGFPRDSNNLPSHTTNDTIMVERGVARQLIEYPREDIIAANVEAALEIVINDVGRFLEHVTGEPAS